MLKNKSSFRKDINGLRAIAVVSVLLFHFQINLFPGGFVGVDIFYVISGFLMTGIIFEKIQKESLSLTRFYLDRARRIIPALVVLCFVLLAAGWFYLGSLDYRLLGKHVVASITFLSNIIYRSESGYFDMASQEKWLLHTWSLSVEWQFYIIYPILILLLRKIFRVKSIGFILFIVAMLSFYLSFNFSERYPTSSFFLLHTRAWEMLIGALICLYPVTFNIQKARIVESGGLGLIGISVFFLNSSRVWPGGMAALPVLGAALVIAASRNHSLATCNALFQWIGKTSYSIYLWHWPVVVLWLYMDVLGNPYWVSAGFLLSMLLGYLSFRFVVQYTHYFHKHSTSTALPWSITFLAVFPIAVVGSLVFYSKGYPERMAEAAKLAAAEAYNKYPEIGTCLISSGNGENRPECVIGDKNAPLKAIVLGDSHAMSVFSAVYESQPNPKGRILFLGYSACPTILDAHQRHPSEGSACEEFLARQFAMLSNEQKGIPVIVINRTSLYIYGFNYPGKNKVPEPLIYFDNPHTMLDSTFLNEFQDHYTASMCKLSVNRSVYILEPIPEMPIDVPKEMERRLMRSENAENIYTDLAFIEEKNQYAKKIIRAAEKKCGATVLDPVPYLCENGKCKGSVNGRPLYFDDDHLGEYGNKLLVPMFREIWQKG